MLFLAWSVEANTQFSTQLPVVSIETYGQSIPEDDPRLVAWMGIIDNGPGQENHMDDLYTDYMGRITIELRGSSSLEFPKKNYAFETQDSLGENLNVSLLGLPEENDWILHGRILEARSIQAGPFSLEEFNLQDVVPGLYLIRVSQGPDQLNRKFLIY